MRRCPTALALALTGVLAAAGAFADDAPVAAPAPSVADADALMATRKLADVEKALAIYRAANKADPKDLDVAWKTADALNFIMRVKTDGNIILIEGASDTPANRKVWSTYANEAYALAKQVATARPKDITAQATLAEAFMFQSSSYGIVKAITSGAANEYKANAERLIKMDAKFEGGVGYVYLAGFYTVAPWPIADLDDALDYAKKALAAEDKNARNQYYAGVIAYRQGDRAAAKQYFEQSLAHPCTTPADNDVCAAYRREAKRGLAAASK